jgi:hypothetical protein
MAKLKTIKLTDGMAPLNPSMCNSAKEWREAQRYRVEQLTDSVEFRTGDLLERAQVEVLIADESWKVTIVPVKV